MPQSPTTWIPKKCSFHLANKKSDGSPNWLDVIFPGLILLAINSSFVSVTQFHLFNYTSYVYIVDQLKELLKRHKSFTHEDSRLSSHVLKEILLHRTPFLIFLCNFYVGTIILKIGSGKPVWPVQLITGHSPSPIIIKDQITLSMKLILVESADFLSNKWIQSNQWKN